MKGLVVWILAAGLVACEDSVEIEIDAAAIDVSVDAEPVDMGSIDVSFPDLAVVDLGHSAEIGPDIAMPDIGPDAAIPDMFIPPPRLRITELMPKNDGVWVDDVGELDDWIEIHNPTDLPVPLGEFTISDDAESPIPLPNLLLEADGYLILWADNDTEQGALHLPFKLSSGGETLYLWDGETQIAEIEFPQLAANTSWRLDASGSWGECRWSTPSVANGEQCGAPPPPDIPDDVEFEDYEWADPWPFPPTPLAITEIVLNPAGFVEVLNTSDALIQLADLSLRVSPHHPGEPWPARDMGTELGWPVASLEPGERIAVPVITSDIRDLSDDPHFEGVIQLWAAERNFPVERIDFMHWPEGAALTRIPDATGRHRFCQVLTQGGPNVDCDPLPAREIGNRLRHLRTPTDFEALAEGGFATGIGSVKFVLDMEGGDAVHLLSSGFWDLHYRFVRREISHNPPLSRCDPDESAVFTDGWREFSRQNYQDVENRRFLLGTIVHHGGSDLHTVEHTTGDNISALQIRRAFFTVMGHVQDPTIYSLRPQSGSQVRTVQSLEGQLPIVGPNAPFRGVTYQPLTETVGYGVLTFVPAGELEDTPLGEQVLVVTDQVPNDIALTGGLITESFQTPLAHVNLLSRNRDTPNMGLLNARADPRIAPLLGSLVRLEVSGADFHIEAVEPAEAAAFWAARRPDGPPLVPRRDLLTRGVIPLNGQSIDDLPRIGAKAAQLGELLNVVGLREPCEGPINVPHAPMGVALVHSVEHFQASGAAARLAELQADPAFAGSIELRIAGLESVQELIRAHPVDPVLLAEVVEYVRVNFGEATRVRFRSSSNTEDLPGFNGAGLYTSTSAQLNDPDRTVEDALRVVWASLWSLRAYDERSYHHIDQSGVAMGVLVHPAFLAERANGVGISRNILDPLRNDNYLNVQIGEASVTNPAPGVSTEQIIHTRWRQPRIKYLGRSSLTQGRVLSEDELIKVSCTLRAIHEHYKLLIDPLDEDPWFAMDIEFKLLGPERRLLVKQARPYSFGSRETPVDCREL